MRKLLALAALATMIIATPALAQSCDPDAGTGNLSGYSCQP
jgi:hypothetical protein